MTLTIFILFALGLFIGSFLNVVVFRIGTGKSIVGGRSQCFSCNKILSGKELVPVFSFIFQGGKCRTCASRISPQYPIVEIVTAVIFGLIGYTLLPVSSSTLVFGSLFVVYAICFSALLVISVYDIRHKMIPTSIVYTGIIVALINDFIILGIPMWTIISGVVFCSAPFALLSFISKEKWMGWGDTLLGILVGALIGWQRGIAAVIISFWIGAILSLAIMFFRKNKLTMKSQVPFGPFLAIATFIVFLLRIDIFTILSWFRIG